MEEHPTTTAAGARRPREGRVIGGVCAAIAGEAGADPVAVRIVAVILAALGAGIPLYLIAWIALPDAGSGRRGLRPDRPVRALVVLLLAAVAGGLVAAASAELLARATGVGTATRIQPALFLILLGLGALWWRERARIIEPAAPAPPPPLGGPAPPALPAPAPPPRTAADALFAPIVIAIGALVAFAPALLPDDPGSAIGADRALAASVVVLGLGLIVGAFLHRGAWIIPFGVGAAVLLAIVAIAGSDFRGGAGERVLAPLSAAGVPGEFRLAAGTADIDLRRLDLEGESVHLDARVAAGQMTVRLPPDAAAKVSARSGFGQISVEPGRRPATRIELMGEDESSGPAGAQIASGISVTGDVELEGEDGRIEIDAEVGFGEVIVTW